MQDIGEEIAGEYLRIVCSCDFVAYNVKTGAKQGEIDVVGINLRAKKIYACEVAVHTRGLHYSGKNADGKKVDLTVQKIDDKFSRAIEYIRARYPDSEYSYEWMLWAPIVGKSMEKSIGDACGAIEKKHGVRMEKFTGEAYLSALNKLREHAGQTTAEMSSPVLRLMQIEEKLRNKSPL